MMWRLVYREAGIELRFDLDIHRLFWVARHGWLHHRARTGKVGDELLNLSRRKDAVKV